MNTKAINALPGFSTFEHVSASAASRARRHQPIAIIALACLLVGGLAPAASGQFQYQRLKSFGFLELSSGSYPSEVIEASDGRLYGTTSGGGTNNAGTVFKLNRDGSGYTILHYFESSGGLGFRPAAALLEGSDGALYGTTRSGEKLFKLNKDGSGYAVLHDLSSDERFSAGLVEGSDGRLYGATSDLSDLGTVFSLNARVEIELTQG